MPSASRLELVKLCSDHYHDLTAQMVLALKKQGDPSPPNYQSGLLARCQQESRSLGREW